MANRNFSELQSASKEVKAVFAKATYDAGSFTLAQGQGVASITRIGAGHYRITLQDSYMRLMFLGVISEETAKNDHKFQIHSQSVSTKTIDFVLQSVADADLANGEIIYVTMLLKNSSAA
mgnify:CR=1 FL=1